MDLSLGGLEEYIVSSPDTERAVRALNESAMVLERYINMWRVGNHGELPDGAADLYTNLVCALDGEMRRSERVSHRISHMGRSSAPISEPRKRETWSD
jgi:hypothetical protein